MRESSDRQALRIYSLLVVLAQAGITYLLAKNHLKIDSVYDLDMGER
jgi:hypothetical protein